MEVKMILLILNEENSQNIFVLCLEMVWILTREQNPDTAILQKAYAVLDKNRITKAYLMRTDQFNCNAENVTYGITEDIM